MTRKLLAFPGLLIAFLFVFAYGSNAQSTIDTASRIALPVDDSSLVTLRGNTHPLARAEYDQGAAPASLTMHRMLLLLQRSPGQEASLEQLLQQQQDKSSLNYHQWLTPQQFGSQFGPAPQDLQTITTWLQSHGFEVTGVAKGGILIEFSGTAAQVQNAFHTSIHQYSVQGKSYYANSSDPQIPTGLSPVISGVRSFYNFPARPMNHAAGVFHRDKNTGKIVPSGKLPIPQFFFGNGCGILGGPCEYLGPYDLATIYNILPLWNTSSPIDGTGQTIAISGETDINPNDWTAFWSVFGVSPPKGKLNIIVNGPDPGFQEDEAEADIDTQWSSAVAKGATIDFVESESTETTLGVDLSAEYIVDNNLAPVMSESYGICELYIGTSGNQFYNSLWQQAAAQGITVFISSGDQGSAVCDGGEPVAENGLAVNGFGSTPYNVAVGGTDFNDLTTTVSYWSATNNNPTAANALGYIPEMTWNDTCTNSEIFNYAGVSTAEQSCNNTEVIDGGFLGVAGGSGGASNCTTSTSPSPSSCSGGYAKPSWQAAVTGIPSDGKRDVPDVSLFASNGFNNSGYIVCESDVAGGCNLPGGDFLGYGGTSVASPAFAGIMALVNQKTGERQGNANYTFYKMAATAANVCNSNTVSSTGANNCIFYDIPSGSTIAMPCANGSPNCTVSTKGDQYGVLSGFATTSGYDQATGLGSVNVTNLVNQWSTYAGKFTASKFSAFTLGPPATITHGQPIPIAATVAPQSGTGTPTGSVVLVVNNGTSPSKQQVTPQVFPLTNGSVAAGSTTTDLVGGSSYTVTAHYSGDGTFAPSDSTPVTVTVNPETSKILATLETFDVNGYLVNLSATSATYGSGFYLVRFDVGDSTATFAAPNGISSHCSTGASTCPTGSLTLSSNGAPFDGGALALNNAGYAEDQNVPTGSYALSISYPGDASYKASSSTFNFSIAKAQTTASASVAGTPVQYGTFEEVAAGIITTSDGITPTGTFTLSANGAPLNAGTLNYEGFPYSNSGSSPQYATLAATGSAHFLTLGTNTISASYSGDANYAPSNSAPSTFTVVQAQPYFTSYGASPSSIKLGQQTTLTAQMFGSTYGVAPTGTITFSDNGVAVTGTVTYTATNGGSSSSGVLSASLPYTPATVGTHSIGISYSGDTNYTTATQTSPSGLVVTGPTFSAASNPASTTVTTPGASASTSIVFTGTNGYAGTIPLSSSVCSGLPSETTCSFSAASVTLSSSAPTATATVTFQTTAASNVPPLQGPTSIGPHALSRQVLALFVTVAAAFLFLLILGVSRPRYRGAALALLLLGGIVTFASCGGGGGGGGGGITNPGTPVGTSNVVLTFSGVGITPPPSVNVQLIVQ
jgi:Pro-kumamolisin, activation domain/Bacterial Ig-like domain (group 3)